MISQIIQKDKFIKKGEYLQIDMQIKMPPFSIKENGYMTLTPLLTGGKNKRELPYFLINGKSRHKGYKQMVRSVGKKNVNSVYNIYKAIDGSKSFSCTYSVQINYENWMDNTQIKLVLE
ncbi:DUF3868 domain-containing protein [Dysgonomonas termitidis]|jgi:hypothetical protein|uniref:DUF3868 domain-containing protein n=1 Tax=Dysgonomonas termitidis TaxID=1516126 RepID=A0ABV9KU80_9BACT